MSELTDRLWEQFGSLSLEELPADVVTVARHCVLDWFGCATAGSREPLASILRDEFVSESGPCSIVGSPLRADPYRAALVNGVAGHALDFDDTNMIMGGHATVPLLPAVLALAEEGGRCGADVIVAYVVGMEVQSRVGTSIGGEHYASGWHTTSTIGVFGAAAAAGWLLGLDSERFGAAMGIAASNAAGVKANFGTMTKPLHPGQAAERGLMAARLASRGFTANSGAVDGNQGFAQAAGSGTLDRARIDSLEGGWATPKTLFKFHAACHLTHAGIEATTSLLAAGIDLAEIEGIKVIVNPAILDVCGIADPRTGLEAKFSLRGTQALLVHGVDTAGVAGFEDGPINRPDIQTFIDRVVVETDDALTNMQTRVEVSTASGLHLGASDVGRPNTDLVAQGIRLRSKFEALVGPVLGVEAARSLGDVFSRLDELASVDEVFALSR
ncbi:MAG: MmgE/PrpD family protein [Actinomycetia bacterium]|nr:MmgE/PrpD family protein [Actinomycetes bacterium]